MCSENPIEIATGIYVIKEDYVQYSVSKTCDGQLREFM